MKNLCAGCLAAALVLSAAVCIAQDDYDVPRTIDGQPDLQGVWANNTITPIERPDVFGDQAFLTDEDIAFLRQRISEITAQDGDALFGDGAFEAAFSGEVKSFEPSTGNYDQAWLVERRIHNRTSQIIDPPNGKYPPRTEAGTAFMRGLSERLFGIPDSYTDRLLSERCISYGLPYLDPGYNSYWQIIQSEDHVVIAQEMIHDTRIVKLVDRPPLDEKIRMWNGDSRGYWDGDTLVIETGNFADNDYEPKASAKTYTERLTRISDDQLRYRITFDNPGAFTAPYTREIIFDGTPDPIYEYACHEGNYSIVNILRGARAQERRAAGAEEED
ncbi:MAG: hypothetical protein R3F41_02165 [Gammaproteobacteria bacterium]|nr:hypothetical protein [Pseudomonadales bacterium]MCP5345901.1 hypothetical protein [Pseudomonadales bacterium]